MDENEHLKKAINELEIVQSAYLIEGNDNKYRLVDGILKILHTLQCY